MRALAKVLGRVTLALGILGIVFLVGMRQKWPLVQNPVRRASRASRSRMLRTAGAPGSGTAVVEHVGRRTGRPYETPVAAVSTADGFVVALPYGATSDWVRNVLASGTAAVRIDGETHDVHRPEVVPMAAVEEAFSSGDQRAHRLFKVEECLRVQQVGAPPP